MEQGCHLLSVMNSDVALSIFSHVEDAAQLALLCRTNKKFSLYLGSSKGGGVHWRKALEKWLFLLSGYSPTVKEMSTIRTILGTNVNVNARDTYGFTLLFWVHNAEVADLLCKAGADPNARDALGHNALMFKAGGEYDIEIARVLIENGCDVNSKDNKKGTLLHHVMLERKATIVPIITTLVALGADVNAVDCDGYTPMDTLGFFRICNVTDVDFDMEMKIHDILHGSI